MYGRGWRNGIEPDTQEGQDRQVLGFHEEHDPHISALATTGSVGGPHCVFIKDPGPLLRAVRDPG